MYNESGIIIADIKRYKETATDEELETLFSNVIIPNSVYYIETLSIEFYDSDDGIKYKISAHGYFHYNNVIQSYSFNEEIASLSEWVEGRNFVFLADGFLRVIDNINNITVLTLTKQHSKIKTVLPQMPDLSCLNIEDNCLEYEKIVYISNKQQVELEKNIKANRKSRFYGLFRKVCSFLLSKRKGAVL